MDPTVTPPPTAAGPSSHALTELMRFVQVVRHRKMVLALAILIACGLGAAYYVTAERIYQSSAEVLVLQTGGNLLDRKDRE
jgi:polysaccharide biosynthesis transport protein